jgi:poly(A) polymerase Pap1
MGLNEAGADIDIICVVPRHVSREDFFGDIAPHGLHAVLKEHPKVRSYWQIQPM